MKKEDGKMKENNIDFDLATINKEDDLDEEPNMNVVDASMVVDDDKLQNYNGMEEEEPSEFNFASTLALRKNLTETFDRHATIKEQQDLEKTTYLGDVKAKIKVFENRSGSKRINGDAVGNNIITECSNKVRFDVAVGSDSNSNPVQRSTRTRPPTIPVSTQVATGKGGCKAEGSLLSVFLRIRPPFSDCGDSSNTVEILKPEEVDQTSKKIRTYPPIQSNAAKVLRGQHHLHTNSNNTDLMFGKSSSDIEDSSVKGVKEYEFNEVFGPSSSQVDIYEGVAAPLVDGLFPPEDLKIVGDKVVGQSALLFSYGITNAGKTYTIMGDECNKNDGKSEGIHKNRGIIPRTLHHMFSKMKRTENASNLGGSAGQIYQLNMSYFEIYNEQIFDLLPREKKKTIASSKTGFGSSSRPPTYAHSKFGADGSLRIREGRRGRTYVRGLGKHRVTSVAHGLELAKEAKSRRHTSSNNINNDSSRSHCICQFELVAYPKDENQQDDNNSMTSETSGYSTDEDGEAPVRNMVKRSVTMWIVDLAGSERSKRTGTVSKSTRQKEAALINSSLMKLTRCLQALRNNQKSSSTPSSVVPFRESKLTHLFMDHLSGASASQTSMIVNINPSAADYDETQHVLSYATVARSVRISEADYNRKRRAIQIAEAGNCVDVHPLKVSLNENEQRTITQKSPPRKIARIAKKLSPRAALARRREQQAAAQKRKAELQNIRGTASSLEEAGEKNQKRGKLSKLTNSKRKLEDEVKELRDALDTSRENNTQLQTELISTKEKLALCESNVRSELAEETKNQINFMREQHNEIIHRLKQQVASAPTLSRSAKKVQMDKAEEMIEELIDKVDECEEEMDRMRKSHENEKNDLQRSLADERALKERDMAALKEVHREERSIAENKISQLIADLESSRKEAQSLRAERDEIMIKYEQLANDSDISTDEEEIRDIGSGSEGEGSPEDSNKENALNSSSKDQSGTSSTPRLRRLPRRKCSEVACANVSPGTKVLSSKKSHSTIKSNGKCGRSPFTAMTNGSTKALLADDSLQDS